MNASINRNVKKRFSASALRLAVGLMGLMIAEATMAQIPILTEESKVVNSDGQAYHYFGRSVSIDRDVAVVAEPGQGGSAFVFRFNGGSWNEEAKLEAASETNFGLDVSVSGDVAIIGATSYVGYDSGSAYIYRFDGTTWNEEARLTPSDLVGVDNFFGESVSIDGDVVLIGEPGGITGTCSAYVFRFDGTTWNEEAKLTASDGNLGGSDLSISGDCAVIAGRPLTGSAGFAYIFRFDGSSWNEEAKLTPSDGEAADHFGDSVSISGNAAVFGAYADDDGGYSSGSAYVFRYNGTNWTQEAKLIAADAAAGDEFGKAVAISQGVVVIGAKGDDDAGNASGSAYVFRHDGSAWNEESKLIASDGADLDAFGNSVSVSGNIAAIGAPNSNGALVGSVYIYQLSDDIDDDGLNDNAEAILGTDPFNPDTDADGLLDGTEVDMAGGTGCPDPLDLDSDNDTLTDGAEVAIGTSPCSGDTDADGLPDPIDPQPTIPDTSSGSIEDATRAVADLVTTVDTTLIDAPNDNAASGRTNSLSTKLHNAANRIADGDYDSAIDLLNNILDRVDGDPQPPDWVLPSDEANVIRDSVLFLISQLS